MNLVSTRAAVLGVALIALLAPPAAGSGLAFTPADELKREVDAAPCDAGARLDAVVALFKRMGASDDDIRVETYGKSRNVVVRKAGTTDEIVVVGAHYDKTSAGCGAVDNWTGVVSLAHAYRSLRPLAFRKTLLFVAFDREEQGLEGSRAMARAISKEEVSRYCAMINFDSFGLGRPQVAPNLSSAKLIGRVAELAERMKMPFGKNPIDGVSADSSAFRERGIPAVTLHGLSSTWSRVLHTSSDKADRVDAEALHLAYVLGVVVVGTVADQPCGDFR